MRISLTPKRWGGALVLLTLLLAGCGDRVKLVPVEGVVKINGQPAANVSVQFQPDGLKGNKGPTSFANTDGEGKFRLKTFDGRDGAVVGAHRVVLADLDEDRPAQGQPMTRPPRLNAQYTLPNSGLQVEVKAGSNPIVLEAFGPRQ
jgi:hypothetical protein